MSHKQNSRAKHEDWELAINTDSTQQDNEAGWAAVVRGTQGDIISAARGKSAFSTIGLVRVAQGLHLAVRSDLKRVTILSDSENVVTMLTEGAKIPWGARQSRTSRI